MRYLLLACLIVVGCKSKRDDDPLVAIAKECGAHSEISCPRPIFNVRDLRAGQAYYREALGFKVDWDHEGTFGAVSRGDAQLFMCQGCQSPPGTWAMMFVRDIDKLHEEFVRRKAIILMPPTDMPWGLREMHVADPDGNVIRFGSSGDH